MEINAQVALVYPFVHLRSLPCHTGGNADIMQVTKQSRTRRLSVPLSA